MNMTVRYRGMIIRSWRMYLSMFRRLPTSIPFRPTHGPQAMKKKEEEAAATTEPNNYATSC
jgi:hypothetical protein